MHINLYSWSNTVICWQYKSLHEDISSGAVGKGSFNILYTYIVMQLQIVKYLHIYKFVSHIGLW